jgi:phosphatidylglycerophosphatase A
MAASPLWLRVLPSRVVINIATLGPVGRVKKGPGTAGTVVGLIWFTLFFYQGSLLAYLLLGGFSIWLAVAICGEAEVRMGRSDPSEVVLDEFVAVPFCFLGLHPYLLEGRGWAVVLAGFLLFRFFDIAKPLGIRSLQRMHGGAGVVIDDLAAAFATCICLHILALTTPIFG